MLVTRNGNSIFQKCLLLLDNPKINRTCIIFQNLAADKTYNDLDVTLKKANEHRNEWFEGVYKCKLDETLYTIMEKIVKAEVGTETFSHFFAELFVINYNVEMLSVFVGSQISGSRR